MQDEDIDLSDIPEITEAQFARAQLRVKGKPVPNDKVPVLLDADLVSHFKNLAGETTYPALINEYLRENVQKTSLEHLLRRIIREELAAAR
jgi:uncharacterized protein (DUF4415 family)